MKKHLLIFAGLLALSLNGVSQSNLVIFAEDGDPFYAYVNGVRQNDKPESNVKVTGLTSSAASLRVEFADKALPQLKQNMQLQPNMEYAVRIKRDMKKQMKLRYFGETPINSTTSSDAATVAYHSTENTGTYNTATSTMDANAPVSNGSSVTSSTTTTTRGTGTPDNVGVNINMSGAGINMNVTGMDPNNVNTTTSTTVTTSSSSSTYQDANNMGANTYNNTTTTTVKGGCAAAMGTSDFSKLKKSVESKPFSDTKMSTAKVATKNGCLSTNQIKEICKLFSMDDDKLAYAKYAFDYCVDKANFYQVSEVFTFSSTTDDLNKFLEQ